jgi:glycosyltransferase involved in cell wall biosynthesis
LKVVVITHNYIRRQGDLTALYLHRLSSGLVAGGLEITVVCPHAPGLLREEVIDGVAIKRFPYPFYRIKPIAYTGNMHEEVAGSIVAKAVFLGFLWAFYRSALKVCRAERAGLVWANWWAPPGLIAARIASKLRLPLVISSHGTDISLLGRKGLIASLSRYVYARTSKATVVSTFLKRRLVDTVSAIAAADVVVLPMPVGMEDFPQTPLPQNDPPVFLSVARYTRQKRLDDIIAAAAKIAADHIDFRIIMVGEGPLENDLKQLVNEKGLSDKIGFVPLVAQQKLAEFYRRADAVVLASEGEGFGLVLVEAGLTGRPVIAARSGGIVDIVDDGVNGLLFEVGRIDELADGMRRLIADRDLRIRLGQSGQAQALERFATPVLVARMKHLFESLTSSSETAAST